MIANSPKIIAAVACLSLLTGSSLNAADTIFYSDGAFLNNSDPFANGTATVDSSFLYGGLDTLRINLDGSYKSGGIDFYSGNFTVPADADTLEFVIYADTTSPSYMNGFTLNLDTGSFNQNTDAWTIDGVPGAIGNFTGEAWHTIAVDLTSIAGFSAGTSQLSGIVAFKNNTNTDPFYIGDIRLTSTIPEPSTYAIGLGVVALGMTMLMRRRHS